MVNTPFSNMWEITDAGRAELNKNINDNSFDVNSTLDIRILNKLKAQGIGRYVSVSKILLQYFPLSRSKEIDEIQEKARSIKEILNGMVIDDLIRLDPSRFGLLGKGSSGHYPWLDEVEIKVAITVTGVNYLEKYLKTENHNSKFENIIPMKSAERVSEISVNAALNDYSNIKGEVDKIKKAEQEAIENIKKGLVEQVVVFIDMVDSTKFKIDNIEKPQIWISRVKQFCDLMKGYINEAGGKVVKYIGDEVMGIFDKPTRTEDAIC